MVKNVFRNGTGIGSDMLSRAFKNSFAVSLAYSAVLGVTSPVSSSLVLEAPLRDRHAKPVILKQLAQDT
ncbi:hypothetical protein B0H12DRAFT_1114013 [Mycena haematopus]|nr:hypothetical protein B0H12DRAFT_1114013 [Mycena haematopus]